MRNFFVSLKLNKHVVNLLPLTIAWPNELPDSYNKLNYVH